MAQYQLPEILRTPLQELCLHIKSLQFGAIESFLAKALQSPDAVSVHNAIELLKTIGALDDTEELTPLGLYSAYVFLYIFLIGTLTYKVSYRPPSLHSTTGSKYWKDASDGVHLPMSEPCTDYCCCYGTP